MKNPKLIFAILISLNIFCCSSNNDDNQEGNQNPTEDGKLIKKITIVTEIGTSVSDFFYHNDNKIDRTVISGTEIDTIVQKHFYENGLLVRSEFQDPNGVPNGILTKYYYNNDQVTSTEYYINHTELHTTHEYFFSNEVLDSVNYYSYDEINFSRQFFYEYDSNGNLTSKVTDYVDISDSDYERTYTYDNKKDLYLGFKPKILVAEDLNSINNKTSAVLTNLSNSTVTLQIYYTYTYDEDGYPISSIASNNVSEYYEYYN